MISMSEKDELQKAIELVISGKRPEARVALLGLEPRIQNQCLRLQLIDAILSVLDPLKDNAKQASLSVEGAKIAEAFGLLDLQSHFMARTADFLMFQVSIHQYRMAMLKLAPSWMEFATEADKSEYESLSSEVDKLEKEVDRLLATAVAQTERSGDKKSLGFVLMSKGAIESSRYLQFKTQCISRGLRSKLWVRFRLFRYPFFEYLLTFWNGDAKKLIFLFNSFRSSLLKAAQLFEEIDDSTAGAAYYNLANDFKTAYKFYSSRKYLAKAKVIATKHNDLVVLQQVEEMYKSIRNRNRDISDYLNGESRESDSI